MRLNVGCYAGPLGETRAKALADQLVRLLQGSEVTVTPFEPGETSLGQGALFASPLDVALMDREIDVAVLGLQDVPIALPEGLKLAAVTQRLDPREAAVTAVKVPLRAIPAGAEVLVDGPRAAAQVRMLKPDLLPVVVPMRPDELAGSVGPEAHQAGIVGLAELRWMGLEAEAAEIFRADEMMPAPGQGALGLVTRDGDEAIERAVLGVQHKITLSCVKAERALFSTMGWDRHLPAGAVAEPGGGTLTLRAAVFDAESGRALRAEATGSSAVEVSLHVADELSEAGAEEIIQQARETPRA